MRLKSRRFGSSRADKKARIEIVPLIDIMFFLLATFVMVSMSMIKNRGISVQLPKSESGTADDRQNYVSLTVSENGEFYLDKQKLPREELQLALERYKASTSDPRVFINGDERANIGALVAALDTVRKVGIGKVGLETEAAMSKGSGNSQENVALPGASADSPSGAFDRKETL